MYGIIVQFMIFIALIKILLIARSPVLCASIYASIVFFFSLLGGASFLSLVFNTSLIFGLSFLYYWLLLRYEGYFLFWVIMIVGLFILFL
ncbi:MAG: hypothetical protein V3W18_05830 [candidate division Zixibacteria bacterium]